MRRDLKLDLLPAQRGRTGQGRELIKRPVKLRRSFYHCRTRHGTLPRLAPKARSLFNQPGFGVVTRQNLRLVLSDVSETRFRGFLRCERAVHVSARAKGCRRPHPGSVRA